MKKQSRKFTVASIMTIMVLSVALFVFANEYVRANSEITAECASIICNDLEQQYGVELKVPKEINVVMTEEEFRMRTELLAIMGAHMKAPSDDLLARRDKLVDALAQKYPERNSTERNEY